jgi:lipopolysaccharide transport protein LptA
MNYDPGTGIVTASGNVRLHSPDGEISGDLGLGSVKKQNFEIHGRVRGKFTHKDGSVIDITCETAALRGETEKNRVVTASGDVRLKRGPENLAADAVLWHMSAERYSATGNVLGNFASYSIDADAVSRDMKQFSARTIRNFTEHGRGITMSASQAEGLINNNKVTELTAKGNVIVSMPDKNGVITRATGNTGVYSLARGTIVISGNATVTQADRKLNSDSIVYFLDTGHIDALGSPKLLFETERKKK